MTFDVSCGGCGKVWAVKHGGGVVVDCGCWSAAPSEPLTVSRIGIDLAVIAEIKFDLGKIEGIPKWKQEQAARKFKPGKR